MKILSFFFIFLLSCSEKPISDCKIYSQGNMTLVAFRIAKHSHLWLQNDKTKIIHEITHLGGRREPIFSLGSKIRLEYCIDSNKKETIIFDPMRYVVVTHEKTRFVCLKEYEYLYPH